MTTVNDTVVSILVGISALLLAAVVAAMLAILRRPRDDAAVLRRLAVLSAIVVAVQIVHFFEELATGFDVDWPETLGLAPWPRAFFVTFNVAWLVIWAVSIPGLGRRIRVAYFPIWFLALGMTLNGVAHPALALREGGYFPGLATAPIVAALGVWLLIRLARATTRDAS